MAAPHSNLQVLLSSIPNEPLEKQLNIGGQEMAAFVHNKRGLALLPLPGDSIRVGLRITAGMLQRHCQRDTNAILLQSRGKWGPYTCDHCRMAMDENRDLAFPACRRLEGHFEGACGNCVIDENEGQCTVRDDKIEKGALCIIGDLSDSEEEGREGEEVQEGSTRAQIAQAHREGFRRIITINNATKEEEAWMDEIWDGLHR